SSDLLGWMQSTGQTSTQAVSFVPMQGSAITKAMAVSLLSSAALVRLDVTHSYGSHYLRSRRGRSLPAAPHRLNGIQKEKDDSQHVEKAAPAPHGRQRQEIARDPHGQRGVQQREVGVKDGAVIHGAPAQGRQDD